MIVQLDKMSDRKFEKVVNPVYESIKSNAIKTWLNDFAAYHFATLYKNDVLHNQSFDSHMFSALATLAEINHDELDYDIIKKILARDYKIKVTSEKPLKIEEIKD